MRARLSQQQTRSHVSSAVADGGGRRARTQRALHALRCAGRLGGSLVLSLRGKLLSMGGFDGAAVHLDWRRPT